MPEERVSTEMAIWVFAGNLFQCVPTSDCLRQKAPRVMIVCSEKEHIVNDN